MTLLQGRHKITPRFAATLLANAGRMGSSFLAGLLLARGLGPSAYGDMNFVVSTSLYLLALLDMGSSSAFFTFLSRSRRGARFHLAFALWLALQAALVCALVLLLPGPWLSSLWVGQRREVVLLGFLGAFFSAAVWRGLESVAEAVRETLFIQGLRLAIGAAHLALVAGMFFGGLLTLRLALGVVILEHLLAALWFFLRFDWNSALDPDDAPSASSLWGEYSAYCRPLLLSSVAGFAAGAADRWLLQFFGGSLQQGFFAAGQQFSLAASIAAASILRIFWKEAAASLQAGDQARLKRLYLETSSLLFLFASLIACPLALYSDQLVLRFLGPRYAGAEAAVAVVLLLPIHQSLGQINGSFYLASGETRYFLRYTVLGLLVSAPATYLLVASPSAPVPGFGLGSLGLALSQVGVQWLTVTAQQRQICLARGWPWPWRDQLRAVSLPLAAAGLSRAAASSFIGGGGSMGAFVLEALLAAALYLAAAWALLRRRPRWLGLEEGFLQRAAARLQELLGR